MLQMLFIPVLRVFPIINVFTQNYGYILNQEIKVMLNGSNAKISNDAKKNKKKQHCNKRCVYITNECLD